MSVGWGDQYRYHLAGQSLETTKLPPASASRLMAYVVRMVAALRPERTMSSSRALASVRDRDRQVVTLIIGDGRTREEVESLAATPEVSEPLIFAGEQRDVSPFTEASDIALICCLTETFPLSALEFLASSVLVIASRAGGNPETFHHRNNGLLYESGNPIALAEAIIASCAPALRRALGVNAPSSVPRLARTP